MKTQSSTSPDSKKNQEKNKIAKISDKTTIQKSMIKKKIPLNDMVKNSSEASQMEENS